MNILNKISAAALVPFVAVSLSSEVVAKDAPNV